MFNTNVTAKYDLFSVIYYYRFRYSFIVKVPRPGDSEGTPFRSSSQAATCYYQFKHSKLEAISLSALP